MTRVDLLKLANNARQVRASMDEPTKCYYAWVNDGLMQQFNRGRDQFINRLDAAVNHHGSIPFDPWSHVGKNH